MAAFQAGEGDLFLISLKAGGTGLNLTAADYVIHLDPWWNPAVEDQASGRAHRIGQNRPVTVYRLVVEDSIEERILELHKHKRDLAADLLDGGEVSARLSEDELLALIRRASIQPWSAVNSKVSTSHPFLLPAPWRACLLGVCIREGCGWRRDFRIALRAPRRPRTITRTP